MMRLIKPYLTFEEVEREFREVFESGMFTKGPYTKQFPQELKNYTGSKHAFLATSATTALSSCLKILNIGSGDEVIVSDFSFPASVNVIEDTGARPVFADVSLDTFNMLPEELERKITDRTRAVIFVDALGNPTGVLKIKEICLSHDIPLIEDAACSIGSSVDGNKVGNIADLTCFSFHPRKLLTTGEGGAILTSNGEYAEKLKVKLNHGAIFNEKGLDFVDYGYNFRLPDLQCIMGIAQLKKLDEIVADRNRIQNRYTELLENYGLTPQRKDKNVVHNMQSVVFKNAGNIDVQALIRHLKSCQIEATIGTYSLSGCTYYKEKYNDVQKNSEWLFNNTITLPCYEGVAVEVIIEAIKSHNI